MSDEEIWWRQSPDEVLAYSLPPSRDVENALAERVRAQSFEADKDYDYLKDKIERSATISLKRLEQLVALMKEYDGEQVEIFLGDDTPVFFEQQKVTMQGEELKVQGAIAPRVDEETLKELKKSDSDE